MTNILPDLSDAKRVWVRTDWVPSSPERDKFICDMIAQGHPLRMIAEANGLSYERVKQIKRKAEGHIPKPIVPTAARNKEIFSESLAGASHAELARKHGISPSRVAQIVFSQRIRQR